MKTSVLDTASEPSVRTSGVGEITSDEPEKLLPEGCCIAGKYTVHGVLGQGGFAVVYDAEHTGLGRGVAIKVLHVGADTPIGLVERFRREARISAVVHHRHVLEVYDTGALPDGSPFLVMERLSGENLAAHIARGPLPIPQAVELGRQLLLAVSAIAEAGIVHRDIKPENVMLHDPGEGPLCAKLVDFGISKRMRIEPEPRLTSHGALVGTPQYMSPEQIQGEEVDVRTDLYAIGAVLYEALTGHPPHERSNFSELLVAVLNAPVPPLRERRPDCPADLAQIIHIALARSRRDRFGSASEFLDALEHFAAVARLPRGNDVLVPTAPVTLPPKSEPGASLREVSARAWSSRPVRLSLAAVLLGAQAAALHVYGRAWGSEGALMQGASTVAAAADLSPERDARSPASAGLSTLRFMLQPTVTPLRFAAGAHTMSAVVRPGERPTSTPAMSLAVPESSASSSFAAEGADLTATAEPAASEAYGDPSQSGKVSAAAAAWANTRAHKQTMKAALAALVRGQLDEAHQRYTEAVKLEPKDAVGFRGLGLVAARLGNHAEAREALERYLALSPRAADADAIAARIRALPAK